MAGRIPNQFIDELLNRVDIVDVVDRRVKLRKTGKNYSACCPFHDEKTPSFSVNPEKQFYYCFGCQAGGNAIGFVMEYENLDFVEAVEALAQNAGLEVPREEGKAGAKPQESNKPLYDCLERSTQFYEQSLRKHPQAKMAVDYFKKRGLTGQIAKEFRLGFAPPGWDNLIKSFGDNEADIKLLSTGGMLVTNDKGRTYDRFRERVMFPIMDQRGRVIAFGGRVLGDEKPKYLNSPETPIFHKSRELYGLYQARKSKKSLTRMVVVEGYMDVIALAQHDIHYAVATLGTATSETHLERLYRMVPEVIFCFDGDDAGRNAAFRALETALPVMEDGRQARFLFLEEGEDPDTIVRKKGRDYLEHQFDKAPALETFLFDRLAQGLDLSTMDGRARYSKVVAPHLHKLPEGVFKTLMFQSLADRTGIDVESLKRFQAAPEPRPEPASTPPPQPAPSAIEEHPTEAAPPPWEMDAPPPIDYDDGYAHAEDDYDYVPPDQEPPMAARDPAQKQRLRRMIGLIGLHPKLACDINLEALSEDDSMEAQLLRDLAAQVAEQPDTNTAALMGYWYGTPEGQLLTELAGAEHIEEEDGIVELFKALLEQMTIQPQLSAARSRLEALKRTNFADLSADERRELLELTQQIRVLNKRA